MLRLPEDAKSGNQGSGEGAAAATTLPALSQAEARRLRELEAINDGAVPLGYHEEQDRLVLYRVDSAREDLQQSILKGRYFVTGCYVLCALLLVLAGYSLVVTVLVSVPILFVIALTEALRVPAVAFLVWLRHIELMYVAIVICALYLLMRLVYFGTWIWTYWRGVSTASWWLIAASLIAFLIVDMALIVHIINVVHGKVHFACVWNDLNRIASRMDPSLGEGRRLRRPGAQDADALRKKTDETPPASSPDLAPAPSPAVPPMPPSGLASMAAALGRPMGVGAPPVQPPRPTIGIIRPGMA